MQDNWGEYSKLVLKELERLNESYENMRNTIDNRFGEVSRQISEIKNLEKTVIDQKLWMEKVTDVWSPSQMKEAKDELYKQKGKWIAAIAIIGFIQIMIGIVVLWFKTKTA